MKRILAASLFCIVGFLSAVLAQDSITDPETDLLLPKKHVALGVFAPLRVATSESIEWQSHPILFLQAPNLKVTVRQKEAWGWSWASRHGFFSPTYLLRRLAREGTGGLISEEFTIPQMAALKNELLIGRKVGNNGYIVFDAGFQFVVKSGKLDRRSTIDLPFIYPRLAVFYSGYQFTLGTQYNKRLTERWTFQLAFQGFFAEEAAFEQSGWVAWNTQKNTQVRLGYFLSLARYPFGTQAHLFVPLLDVVWNFKLNK